MQHSLDELLTAAGLIDSSYSQWNHRAGTIELLVRDYPTHFDIAMKGTSRNPGIMGTLALLRDILSDLRFFPRKDMDIGWHPAGFLTAAEGIVDYFRASGQIHRDKPIRLQGHSLGGAVALLLGYAWYKKGYRVDSIITLGAPNVGKLPPMLGVRVSSIRNGKDIVPAIPPFYGENYLVTTLCRELSRGRIRDHLLDSYIDMLVFLRRNPELLHT